METSRRPAYRWRVGAAAATLLFVACGQPTTSAAHSAATSSPAVALTSPAMLPSASASTAPELGLVLGNLRLGMTSAEILAARGEPALRTATHGLGSPEWRYADGLNVYLRFAGTADPGPVWGLMARPPFKGATSEGLRLGDSTGRFRALYARFTVTMAQSWQQPSQPPQPPQLQVVDPSGTILNVIFEQDRATSIFLHGR